MTPMTTNTGYWREDAAVPPENTCNACGPAIQDTLYATWSGLGGDLAWGNQKLACAWVSGCNWLYVDGDQQAKTWWEHYPAAGKPVWQADVKEVSLGGACKVHFYDDNLTSCDPYDTYDTLVGCFDSDCPNPVPDTCDNSVGAAVTVSSS